MWFIVVFLHMNLLLMRSCLTCMPVLHGAGTGTSPSGSSSSGRSGIGKRYIMQMSWRIKARVIILHGRRGLVQLDGETLNMLLNVAIPV